MVSAAMTVQAGLLGPLSSTSGAGPLRPAPGEQSRVGKLQAELQTVSRQCRHLLSILVDHGASLPSSITAEAKIGVPTGDFKAQVEAELQSVEGGDRA